MPQPHRGVAAGELDGVVQVVAAGRAHGALRGHHAVALVLHHHEAALVVQRDLPQPSPHTVSRNDALEATEMEILQRSCGTWSALSGLDNASMHVVDKTVIQQPVQSALLLVPGPQGSGGAPFRA